MGLRSFILKPFARQASKKLIAWKARAVEDQKKILNHLISSAADTVFGKDHGFHEIKNHADFLARVPIRDYEALKPYIERVKLAEKDVLWPGLPVYFAKTSGTTSGTKYIPLTKESLPNHFGSAKEMAFHYIAQTGKGDYVDGKLIFLSGSPELFSTNGILTGRLSGISNHLIPKWLKLSQLPSYETNCIEDWEEKLERIIDETIDQDMRMISGIPPWVQMYFERLLERSGKANILELFPNFSMFIYGGVNYEPYRAGLEKLIGGRVPSLEVYPASEGFIAFQDDPEDPTLLLNTNSGIFFEFVPVDKIFEEHPPRLGLEEVEKGVNYAVVLSSTAGLWAYNLGDTIQFVSTDPYKIIVTGRIKHFISAFGEHVIGKEVENALLPIAESQGVRIVEFTVAPQVNPPEGGLPYHEWFIEFDVPPGNIDAFASKVDKSLLEQNIYYQDLIEGKILKPLVIRPMQKGSFINYMRSQGKLGGQNKVPRLANDRKIAEALKEYQL